MLRHRRGVAAPDHALCALQEHEQARSQALHRVLSRSVGQRTARNHQICAFLLGTASLCAKGPGALRQALPSILAPANRHPIVAIIRLIEGSSTDWRRFDHER